jgi:adenosylcobinamide-phosphate synthase
MSTRARAILLAMLLDLTLGDQPRFHPVAGFGRVAAALERRLWAPSRLRGAAYVATLVPAAGLVGRLAARRGLGSEAMLLWTTLGGRSLARHALRLADLVAAGELDAARRIAPTLMGRDPRDLDGPELCRGAVESVAENTADAVVGAVLWHGLLGPLGSGAYRAANTLDAMIGHRSAHYRRFGWAAARLDDALTWPAARVGAAVVVALAPLVGGDRRGAWRVLCRDGRAHPSPNAGLLEAAFAGALGVRLGGTLRYGAGVEHRPQLGDGKRPTPADVRRAVRLSVSTSLACTVLAAAVAGRIAR